MFYDPDELFDLLTITMEDSPSLRQMVYNLKKSSL